MHTNKKDNNNNESFIPGKVGYMDHTSLNLVYYSSFRSFLTFSNVPFHKTVNVFCDLEFFFPKIKKKNQNHNKHLIKLKLRFIRPCTSQSHKF